MEQQQFGLTQDHLMVVEAAQGMARKLKPKMDEHDREIFEHQRYPQAVAVREAWAPNGMAIHSTSQGCPTRCLPWSCAGSRPY